MRKGGAGRPGVLRKSVRSLSHAVFALPVSGNLVCLWVVTPPEFREVELVPEGDEVTLVRRRRLIVSARRLNLFLFEIANFKSTHPCTLSYLASEGTTRVTSTSAVRLADWCAPLVSRVVRLLVEQLEEIAPGGAGARLLARFFSIVSAWRVPCAFAASIGEANVAAFDMALSLGGSERLNLYRVSGASVLLDQVRTVPLGARSAFVTPGELPDTFYLDTGRELLELVPEPAAGTAFAGADAWIRSLDYEACGKVLDALAAFATRGDRSIPSMVGHTLTPSAEVGDGALRWHIHAALVAEDSLYVLLEAIAQRSMGELPVVAVSMWGDPVGELQPWRCLRRESGGNGRMGELLVYRQSIRASREVIGPLRLVLSFEDSTVSTWLALSSLDGARTRQLLRTVVPWSVADKELINALHVPAASIADRSAALLPEVELYPRSSEPGRRDPLFSTVYDGDIERLHRTVVALALTTPGVAPSLRFVVDRIGTAADTAALYALCRHYRLPATAILLDEGDWLGFAFMPRPGDERFSGTVIVPAGTVPRNPCWWQSLAPELKADPEAVWWHPPEGGDTLQDLSTLDLAADDSLPILAFGPDAGKHLALTAAFSTLEGFVVHLVTSAARAGALRSHQNLTFHCAGPDAIRPMESWKNRRSIPERITAARLDQAVLDSLARRVIPAKPVLLVSASEKVRRLPRRGRAEAAVEG